MNTSTWWAAAAMSLALGLAQAAEVPGAPAYRPQLRVSTTLRISAHDQMSAVTSYWSEGFRRFHPDARIEITLKGSAAAMPALYTGYADIALLGRETNITDENGFGRVKQYKPTQFELMGGSLDVPGKSDALVVYVHRDNPLRAISLAALDAAFGHERRRGHVPVSTWGDLGLGGAWAARPLSLYGYDIDSGTGVYFRRTVLGNSFKLNWDSLREFKDGRRMDGTVLKAAEQIAAAMKDDPTALAIGSLRYRHDTMRALAIVPDDGGPPVEATRETLLAGTYPLARRTLAFVDVPPRKSIDANVREFLRYVLSREGQADVARDHGYLPLPAAKLQAERARLDD